MARVFSTLLIASLAGAAFASVYLGNCKLPPAWRVGGQDPMAAARANRHVVLLALLAASWPFCQKQAAGMEALLQNLPAGITKNDVSFMIINGASYRGYISELTGRVKSFPVYQEGAKQGLWSLVDGKKDDFLIYDQCGRLAYHLTYPHVYLRYSFVRDYLVRAHTNSHCGGCVEPTPRKKTTTAPPTNVTTTNQNATVAATTPTEHVTSVPKNSSQALPTDEK